MIELIIEPLHWLLSPRSNNGNVWMTESIIDPLHWFLSPRSNNRNMCKGVSATHSSQLMIGLPWQGMISSSMLHSWVLMLSSNWCFLSSNWHIFLALCSAIQGKSFTGWPQCLHSLSLWCHAKGSTQVCSYLCVRGYQFVVTNPLKPIQSDKVLRFDMPFILWFINFILTSKLDSNLVYNSTDT